MSKNEIKYEALQKRIKGELKTLITYQYEEIDSLGGYKKLLTDIISIADEISKIEDSLKQEAQKALEAEEREEREARAFVAHKPKKKILD